MRMALSEAQLLMLDCLIYTDYCENGYTVKKIIEDMRADIESKKPIGGCEMTNEEWSSLIATIEKEPSLLNYTVQQYRNDGETGMRAACFVDSVDDPKDVNVVFRGTANDYEWHDNGEGGYLSDTVQQERAAKYIEDLPAEYGNVMTVTGHSKGGNKAQYVTIATDRIVKCVSFDGQGFSQEFIDKYQPEIKKKANRIVSISASDDYINCLLYPIAGNRNYIQTETQKEFLHYHKPNILLDENGNLKRQGNQSNLSKLLNEYTTYMISTLPEPERSITVDGIIALLESGDDKESIWQSLYAGVVAVSHVDDFAFNYIGDTYGFPARLCATYVAAVACPHLFLDDLMDCGKDMVNEVLNQMYSLAGVINDRLVSFGQKAKAFGKSFVEGISSFANKVKESYNMLFNRGYQYASINTYIELNTATMRSYADWLNNINSRICALDRRMNALYGKVGLRDLLKLLRADVMTGYNWRISNCAKYLAQTANDFEGVERDVSSQY